MDNLVLGIIALTAALSIIWHIRKSFNEGKASGGCGGCGGKCEGVKSGIEDHTSNGCGLFLS